MKGLGRFALAALRGALALAAMRSGAAPAQGSIPTGPAPAGVSTLAPGPGPAPAVARPGNGPVGVAGPVVLPGQPARPAVAVLPPQVQVVRFHGPAGARVEVLGPPPEPVPVGAEDGLLTVGLRVGVGYHLKVTNLPDRPRSELYPVVELVGHLHRPPAVDPAKYPIRIQLMPEDVADVLDRGRMVTHVVYLEDPKQAIPLHLPKDEIPVVTLSPAEDPLRVASALGRVVAVVWLGGRTPTPEEVAAGFAPIGPIGGPCPFLGPDGGRCPLPRGPACGTPPPPDRMWMPRDEFLCDGGDHGRKAGVAGDGALAGIDPKDAVVGFRELRRAHVLPTNVVCVYAPRFAAVRIGVGPNEAEVVTAPNEADQLQRQEIQALRQGPKRLTQNLAPEIGRCRMRPSAAIALVGVSKHIEVRVLNGLDQVTHVAGHIQDVGPEIRRTRVKPAAILARQQAIPIINAEGAVVTGIVEGAGEQVMAWKPQEVAQVEAERKPGLAVIKQVDAAEAEPGDVLTYTITYRNMGGVPVASVSVVDSLLPRLEYVRGSAQGPAGTVFTAAGNGAGAMELRWDVGTVAPGAMGAVRFQARVR